MKIVDLKTFLTLPNNTVFMKFNPMMFESLCVKQDSIINTGDFYYEDITNEMDCSGTEEYIDVLKKAISDNTMSIPLEFNCTLRDGFFEKEQLFAVYEQKDIDGLIEKLKTCKGV